MKFSGSEAKTFGSPPALGRDTHQVLSGLLHYDDEKIRALRADKVV